MKTTFQPAIATGVDLGDRDGAAGADSGADQRRAAMAGDVEARIDAALHVQVLSHAPRDVGSPTYVAAGVGQRRGEVDDVHAVGAGQVGKRDHATLSVVGWPYVKTSWS